MHNNDFIILPPSKGYIGSKLNIQINKFAYIISGGHFRIWPTAAITIFVKGPANAINIFFICTFLRFLYVLNIILIPNGIIFKVSGFKPSKIPVNKCPNSWINANIIKYA